MLPFLDAGCEVYGIDIDPKAIENARESYRGHPRKEQLTLIAGDIYDVEPSSLPAFDLIIMRDVLEHIHDQEKFIRHLSGFLKSAGGGVFMAFPPFCMPFGGHQQMCISRVASRLPYWHLLPRRVYEWLLRLFGESEGRIAGLLEIKDTRIHLWRFHKMVNRSKFRIVKQTHYLINPNYQTKFGLKPRKLPWAMNIPVVREFFITTSYVFMVRQTS